MNKPNKDIKSFEELKVWKTARELQKKVVKLVKTFSKYEQYRLVDQMICSSRSVARNVAEGYGRYHFQENIQFCRQPRGSLCELLNDIIAAYDEEYINLDKRNELRADVDTCHRLLNGNISYLKRAKSDNKVSEDETIYVINPNNK